MKNSDKGHDRFGELSALAIIGQVSAEEYDELKTHLETCAACREEHDGLAGILLNELPLAHADKDSDLELHFVPQEEADGSRKAMSARALSFGFATQKPGRISNWWENICRVRVPALYACAAGLALFVIAGTLAIRVAKDSNLDAERAAQVTKLGAQVSELRGQIRDLNDQAKSAKAVVLPKGEPSVPYAPLRDYAKLQERNRDLEAQLKTVTEQMAGLKDEANSGAERESQISARLSETQGTLEKLTAELKTLRESNVQDGAFIATQQSQLHEVEEQLTAAKDSMERDRRLLVADRDIRDLMGARNLRIVDVFDVDSKGRTRKPFGRVFFTEGKSLIFYAFDLGNDQPGLQSAAYQAWGSDGSFERGVRSLGIFYRDDQKANRWVLKFEDPAVLAEIDSVFVTVEPPGGSKKPTGGRLLAAYVKASLNHP